MFLLAGIRRIAEDHCVRSPSPRRSWVSVGPPTDIQTLSHKRRSAGTSIGHSGSKTALIQLEREENSIHVKVEDREVECRQNDWLRFSPKAREWESKECASAYAIFKATWSSNPTV